MLGVPDGVAAVDVLSARNIEWMDAGLLNGERFLTSVQFPKIKHKGVRCDGMYTMMADAPSIVEIRNMDGDIEAGDVSDPTDGRLEAVMYTDARRLLRRQLLESRVGAPAFEITYDSPVVATMDGKEVKGEHFTVTVEPKVMRIVTGKGRLF
jgi:hypothetical protein